MRITTKCPKCGKMLSFPAVAIDSLARCRYCGAPVQVTHRRGASAAPSVGQGAEGQSARGSGAPVEEPPDLTAAQDPWGDTDAVVPPPLAPVLTGRRDGRMVWYFAVGGVVAVLLAAGLVFWAVVLRQPAWELVHHDEIIDLKAKADAQLNQGKPQDAYASYRALEKLVEGHPIEDPAVQEELKKAWKKRDEVFVQMSAAPPPVEPPSQAAAPPSRFFGVPTNGGQVEPVGTSPTSQATAPTHLAAARHPPVRTPPDLPPPLLTDEQIGASISHGVDFLYSKFGPKHVVTEDSAQFYEGADALVVDALVHCSRAIHDDRLDPRGTFLPAIIDALKQMKVTQHEVENYTQSLRTQALAAAGRAQDRTFLEMEATGFIASTRQGGYSYGPKDPRPVDASNSQYGLLATWAAAEEGVFIPMPYWLEVEKYWADTQLADGTWPYRTNEGSNPSMTVAGINALFVAHDYLDPASLDDSVGRDPFTPQLARGLAWLESGNNCINDSHQYYGLYGVERAGLASGFKFFGAHDWYREMAARVIAGQWPDGSWGKDPVATSFILLFLARGRHPLLMSKLRFDGYWANRPRDVANLARYAGRALERPLNWQIVPLDRDWTDWADSPVLFLSSHQAPEFTSADEEKLRQYALNGGLLVSQADGGSAAFTEWANKLGKRLFPAYGWSDLPPTDPLFSIAMRVKEPPRVRAISNGSRLLYVHLPQDVSKYWQVRGEKLHQDAFDLGVNLFVYASGKSAYRNRLATLIVPPTPGKPTASIALAETTVNDERPEPAAWPRFARWLRRRTDLEVRLVPVALQALTPAIAPLAHLTGVSKFTATDFQAKALRDYVDAGGVVLIDPCGGPNDFDQSVREDLLVKAFPDAEPRPVAADHPLLTASGDGMTALGLPDVTPYSRAVALPHGRNLEILRSGKGFVIVCPVDLTTSLLGANTWGVAGYNQDYALNLAKNWVLWTWDGAKE